MIEFNTEYFSNNLYFFLKESKDKISLYYSVAETLTESRKNDDKINFDKKDTKKVKNSIGNILKSKRKITKAKLKNHFDKIKDDGELDELVDSEGSMLGSRIPNLNQALHPRKTMDQTVPMSRVSNDPVTRGYRVYWGESVNGKVNIVSEVDYSDAFGYEETKDMDYDDTLETLTKMGVEDPEGRANEMGKTKKLDKSKKPGAFVKQRLSEKDTLEESQKQMMRKMVEDIVTKKSKNDSDVIGKESSISKILMKNLQTIKKLAEKEGISTTQLIKTLKSNE
jgi:antitoxin component HigA of HigAB toxin-antitoxin module